MIEGKPHFERIVIESDVNEFRDFGLVQDIRKSRFSIRMVIRTFKYGSRFLELAIKGSNFVSFRLLIG